MQDRQAAAHARADQRACRRRARARPRPSTPLRAPARSRRRRAASTSCVSSSRSASRPSSCTASSSVVRSGRVAMRHVCARRRRAEAEVRLRVADVDGEQHVAAIGVGGSSGGVLSGGRSSSIVTSCVVWMSVRGMMRVGPVLVPDPDVLHRDVDHRVRRLVLDLEIELVAEVGRLLREHAVAEQPVDVRVLLLEPELQLGVVFLELVDIGHVWPSPRVHVIVVRTSSSRRTA